MSQFSCLSTKEVIRKHFQPSRMEDRKLDRTIGKQEKRKSSEMAQTRIQQANTVRKALNQKEIEEIRKQLAQNKYRFIFKYLILFHLQSLITNSS